MRKLLSYSFLLTMAMAQMLAGQATKSVEALSILDLRCEYLEQAIGIEAPAPRLSWRVESPRRGAAQTAWQVRVASSPERLASGEADLWDSGRRKGSDTNQIAYAGRELSSGADCYWQVRVWDESGGVSAWSEAARWAMGLLREQDWKGQWISYRDEAPLHKDRKALHLPAPRHYRKEFSASKPIKRAVVYASSLGIYDLYVNGERVGDAYFQPGWSDYAKRAYYRTHEVTDLLRAEGANALGAIVADGWYSGYVGYALLVGYGPSKVGRYLYGKTPALLMQLEIEYEDGSKEVVATDASWRVTGEGPTSEADMLMGEAYDARKELAGWSRSGFQDGAWEQAILASENPPAPAIYTDAAVRKKVDLSFSKPLKLQSYLAPPIVVTQELAAKSVKEVSPGTYIFDLGQNFAGNIRIQVQGEAGQQLRFRYGEMLKDDGTLMVENLRRARATDFYTLKGDPNGEIWTPRFTYHGFQYVEVTGLAARPELDMVTGLVMHNDTPLSGSFACSDPVLTQFGHNAQWTQRANFVEVPTDCPQRDERLGWMGDAQAYIRTASYNADVAAFFTKWMDDVEESQRSFGAYPDYAPYPMAHGGSGKTFGTGWMDAGIICPWTIWKVYGDTRMLEEHWESMTRFMDWRHASSTNQGLGTSLGNPWGDWLNAGESTPIEFIDVCYNVYDLSLMAEMATAIGRPYEAEMYLKRRAKSTKAFLKEFVKKDGSLSVDSQTAYVLSLWAGMLPEELIPAATAKLAEKIAANGYRMTTGFLGTRSLLPALTEQGEHDLATRLFQSREYPSWGYEVINGANSVWERWDSYTKEYGFNGASGTQNAGMNSFSHYAFGAVMEWAYRYLAGIDTEGAGYRKIVIRPVPPSQGGSPQGEAIHWVEAHYDSINGRIESSWKIEDGVFELNVSIPANTSATIYLPDASEDRVSESGIPLSKAQGIVAVAADGSDLKVEVGSGAYRFAIANAQR